MSFQFHEITGYLHRHPNYLSHLMRDIIKLFWWKLCGRRIVVITTGSGGVGDYLWIRNYMPLIRGKGYKVILIAMSHWREIVESFDKDNTDIIRYFESCLSPKKIETFFFKLFKADVFLNFRTECIADFVRYKTTYNDKGIPDNNGFYEEKNNATFRQFVSLPEKFNHTLPIIEPSDSLRSLSEKPYVILVERGNTQGSLSAEQVKAVIKHLKDKGYYILFNGDYNKLLTILDDSTHPYVINGSKFIFPQYTWLVANSAFVVTVNTALYHFALQLNRPCVIISNNEHHTLKLHQPNQEYVFNYTLKIAYDNNNLSKYIPDLSSKLATIDHSLIINAINRLEQNTVLK